ncbi:hypothetical protein EVAR_47694_1 [Eumeta japonica]|uniref:Uncharacterized protein n=1 Tax=Eumeta variegata TaxID=151549 RepID=A0A4C1XMI5_EUMVA|nr:hypothetical protein EVAR_47694_1 [Eumeta japonica]
MNRTDFSLVYSGRFSHISAAIQLQRKHQNICNLQCITCTHELHISQTRGRGRVLRILSVRAFVRGSSTPYLRVRVRDGRLMLPHARASYRRGYDPDGPVVMAPFHGSKFEDFPRQPKIKSSCQWALHAPEAVLSAGKGHGATTRIALMDALRIPGAMRAHDGRDAGSLQAGGALPETISP